MRYKLIKDRSGAAYKAIVTLTDQERNLVERANVPMIYYPGGMGPSGPFNGNTIGFGGACLCEVEKNLLASLAAFKDALKTEIARQAEVAERIKAEEAGYEAFPGGRYLDAMRGWKSFPDRVRCPFKISSKVAAWDRGYARAHAETAGAA